MDKELVQITKDFVKAELKNAEGGHDWFHTERVFNNAIHIAKNENVDINIVALASLLHDIADSKFHNGDETIGPRKASTFLIKNNVNSVIIEHVIQIIENMSYKNSFDEDRKFDSKELQVVQDADRLDAIGAIGIARCFNYGGFKNRALHNPEIKPNLNMTKDEYKKSKGPTINHFYEKLLLLKDQMNTPTGKKMAQGRHDYMVRFLDQFYNEWDGNV